MGRENFINNRTLILYENKLKKVRLNLNRLILNISYIEALSVSCYLVLIEFDISIILKLFAVLSLVITQKLSSKITTTKFSITLNSISLMLLGIITITCFKQHLEPHFLLFISIYLASEYLDAMPLYFASIISILFGIIDFVIKDNILSPENNYNYLFWIIVETVILNIRMQNRLSKLYEESNLQANLEITTNLLAKKIDDELFLRDDLSAALKKAEDANQSKSIFLANMSHEIRTPLNSIRGCLHLIKNAVLSEKEEKFLKTAINSCNSLALIVSDILDLSKIEAGKIEISSEFFNIRHMIHEVIETHFATSKENNLLLASYVDPSVPEMIKGDKVRLSQILNNLLSNALKYTKEGWVLLEVTSQSIDNDFEQFNFQVKDTGLGIPDEKQDKIFEAFNHVDLISDKNTGTGLGLSIAKELIELMNGSIGFKSEFGKGSTFWIDIIFERAPIDIELNRYFTLEKTKINLLVYSDNDKYSEQLGKNISGWGLNHELVCNQNDLLLKLDDQSQIFKYSLLLISSDKIKEVIGLILSAEYDSKYATIRDIPIVILIKDEEDESLLKLLSHKKTLKMLRPLHLSNIFDSIISLLAQLYYNTNKETKLLNEADEHLQQDQNISCNVLIAEDNEVNQIIAKELLIQLGVTPLLAPNGLKAVNEYKKGGLDLILMDCHMPEMDGITATKAIRDYEHSTGSGSNIPIVALTADVTKETYDKCYSVGMNDYISKPIDPLKLKNILIKYVETYRAKHNISLPIDLDLINTKYSNNKVLLRTIIKHFYNQLIENKKTLRESFTNNQLTQFIECAHSLKGASATMGAKKINELACNLELYAKNNKLQSCQSQIDDLETLLDECVNYINSNHQDVLN